MSRLEIAVQLAAAMVSSISDERQYARMKRLAVENGNMTVSAWIAEESFKQADALLVVNDRQPDRRLP